MTYGTALLRPAKVFEIGRDNLFLRKPIAKGVSKKNRHQKPLHCSQCPQKQICNWSRLIPITQCCEYPCS